MLEYGMDGKGSIYVPLARYKHSNKSCLFSEHLRDFWKTQPCEVNIEFSCFITTWTTLWNNQRKADVTCATVWITFWLSVSSSPCLLASFSLGFHGHNNNIIPVSQSFLRLSNLAFEYCSTTPLTSITGNVNVDAAAATPWQRHSPAGTPH